jgi:Ser/Thr protein kinase RdoA (MazF antagonist)
VLDLGYLLLTCHLGQKDPFALQADPAAIGAVVHGYSRGRQLTPAEVDALEDAVRYDLARRAVLEGALFAVGDHWETDVQLRKWLAREAIASEVAVLARAAFESEPGIP